MEDDANELIIPIFPLAAVLVPGELMPLHIFEERYRAMINDALASERRFGLSHVAEAEVGAETPPRVGSIGCVAQVTAVIPLADGRMNILAVGAERYVVRSYEQLEPYLVARVVPIEDDTPETPDLVEVAERVRSLFARLAAAARALSDESADDETPSLDAAPEQLSFLVAANVALENDVKQRMLETTDTRERLRMLDEHLSGFVDAYEYRAEMQKRSKTNGHGEKKPGVVDDDE